MLVCWPCSRRLGPVDRCIGHLTEVGWPVQWSVGLGCRGRAGAVPRSWRRCGASGVRVGSDRCFTGTGIPAFTREKSSQITQLLISFVVTVW